MRVFALLEGSSNSPPFWWRIWKDNILWKPICSWFQGSICTAHTDCQCIRAWHFHDQLLTKTNTGRHYFPYCCWRGQRYKRRHQCRSSAQIIPERYFLSPFGKWIKSCKFCLRHDNLLRTMAMSSLIPSRYVPLIVLLVGLYFGAVCCQLSQKQKNLILRQHNDMRRRVTPVAANMLEMVWARTEKIIV